MLIRIMLLALSLIALGCETTQQENAEGASNDASSDCRGNGLGCNAPFECVADLDGIYDCRQNEGESRFEADGREDDLEAELRSSREDSPNT